MIKKINDLKEKMQKYAWHFEKRYQYSIYSAIATGFLAYIYYMTHNIHNYDNIFTFAHDNGTGLGSGRWFLHIMNFVMNQLFGNNGYFHTTVINTVATVFLLEICCLLIINIFELENPLECIAITAVTIAFPTIGATLIFNYTVAYYMVASVLCTFAVWLIKNDRWYGMILAVFLIAMGLGTYQSYFPYVAALMIILLIHQTMSDKSPVGIVINAVKYLGILIMSFAFYMQLNNFFLWRFQAGEISSYQGLDQMGKLDLLQLPQLIYKTYQNFFSLTYKNYLSISACNSIQKLFLVLYIFTLAAGIIYLIKDHKEILRVIEFIVFYALFPLAADSITILAPQASIYVLMIIGMVTIFYLPFVVCKGLPMAYNIQKGSRTLISCVILIISLFYCYQSNVNYTELYYTNKQTENYFSILYGRILSQPGYKSEMEIVFAGDTFSKMPDRSMYSIGELRYGGNYIDVNVYSRKEYMNAYLGMGGVSQYHR